MDSKPGKPASSVERFDRSGPRNVEPAFDVIVVEGGSAGAVLANRLSEEASRRVLLIEAGKAYPPHGYPNAVRLQTVIGGDPEHDWGFTSEVGWGKKAFSVPRGKGSPCGNSAGHQPEHPRRS